MKRALRRAMRARRSALSDEDAHDAARRLTQHLQHDSRLLARTAIAGYMPLGREADPTGFLRVVLADARRVFLPRVVGQGLMEFVEVTDLDQDVTPGAYGILEPVGAVHSLTEIEVFLVPGVAFDAKGGRLGMGQGFYDRALASCATGALLLGVGHAFQLVEEIPVEPHDVALHGFVSPQGLSWFERSV